jgi:hypothetical protein
MLYRQVFTGNPQLEVNVQHVLLKRGGIAADANQKASLADLPVGRRLDLKSSWAY